MTFSFWLLLVDALMAGVILAVQLVVYPAYQYFNKEDLVRWHRTYTKNITLLVAPLMLAQLTGGVFWTLKEPGLHTAVYLLIIVLLWAVTFLRFVPLHRRIDRGTFQEPELRTLVRLNWIRTLLWIVVFAGHIYVWGIYP
ncbi:DUF1772 domain-containing protein [Robiginitalea aurantiaca]|uniref:DUF1772 domain-containing protein n=1 Tax=Robiginitalea aurantiaca TaxID=3056915 RepID=A0ABT7WIL9_9FLAO|nr:DUF1772 domain-containing protein [Robiginitalea aurantiaca]MDM9632778.1 DUF1772 domain-containing protein [Robiginitalea aurantiaca]